MKELTAFDVYNLVKEAQILAASKLENIYQTGDKTLYLQFYVSNKPKQLLRIIAGKAFFLTKNRPEFPENIMRFCSYLRKYLAKARIKEIKQIDYERIIKFVFTAKNEDYELFVELFGKGNFILVKNSKIICVAEEQIWHDREIKSGIPYSYPKINDSKEIFQMQKQKGLFVSMEKLDEDFSKETKSEKTTAKDKEIKKIKTIIEKQTEQLGKILKEAEEHRKKGELIYENYQKLQEIIKKDSSKKSKLVVDL